MLLHFMSIKTDYIKFRNHSQYCIILDLFREGKRIVVFTVELFVVNKENRNVIANGVIDCVFSIALFSVKGGYYSG